MWLKDLVMKKRNEQREEERVEQLLMEMEEKQKFDIAFHNYWDTFNNSERLIRSGARMFVKYGHAKDLINGAIMYAQVGFDLKYIETIEENGKTILVFKGPLQYDVPQTIA